MQTPKQKEEPFPVKRTRMRDSVIKCKEILSNYSQLSSQLKKNRYQVNGSEGLSTERGRLHTEIGGKITEYDLLNKKTTNFNLGQMKDMIRLYQCKRTTDAAHQMLDNGLAVKKINQQYTSSRNARARTEYQERVAMTEGIAILEKKNEKTLKKIELKEIEQQKKARHLLQVTSINPPLSISHQFLSKAPRFTSRKKAFAQTTSLEPTSNTDQLPQQKKGQSNELCFRGIQKQYLYQKMANLNLSEKQRFNPVYERRIRSYTQFLWKMMLAHNISINLELHHPSPFLLKHKAYIGPGNNCNMVMGLIKRRFWWSVSQDYSEDCLFIWSQLKNNKIFRRQESATSNITMNIVKKDGNQLSQQRNLHLKHFKMKKTKNLEEEFQINKKIWSESDCQLFQNYFLEAGLVAPKDEYGQSKSLQIHFSARTKEIKSKLKHITSIQDLRKLTSNIDENKHNYYRVKPLVHNHLQNNFHLGNKKALFHNLKYYYSKIEKDPFDFIPLTFHIKHGFRDPQYKHFTKYYQQRNEKIKQNQQENGFCKQRNIWIVKPGENSNRGRGITVIDQIYELDNIMKKSIKKRVNQHNKDKDTDTSKTFIVQMYIDKPLLYNERKFDIRHYMLITNLYGVTKAYWYEQGYIRTSSYLFDVDNFQPEIHLTNDAIQKRYIDYGRYELGNKISYSEFQNYLTASFPEKKYDFKKEIIPKMRQMAIDAARSVYLKMNPKNQMHNFQIFGLDFMIDKNFRPWLIEINTNPCLQCCCPLLNRIIPYMVEQSLKLSLDLIYPPPSHYPNSAKHFAPYINVSNFKYELIFDSLTDGEQLFKIFGLNQKDISCEVGDIDDDEVFKDDGIQIKLQDYT